MKKLLVLWIIFTSLYAEVKWFDAQELLPKSSHHYVGYGVSKQLTEAKLLAKKDIAQQISLHVKSVDTSNYARTKEGSTSEFSTSVEQTANIDLELTKTLKLQKEEGLYYVALEYENLTFEQRLAKMLKVKPCVNSSQHPYLKQTLIFEEINELTSCTFNLKLSRKNHSWGLTYKDIFLRIPNSKIKEFYITTNSPEFSVKPSSKRLKNGEVFDFSIKSNASGYITIFDIYANGVVTVIENNMKVYKGKLIHYPEANSEIEFAASVLENEDETYDLYVAIFTKTPLNTDQFIAASEEIETEKFHYNLDRILQLMNKHTFNSTLLRIRP